MNDIFLRPSHGYKNIAIAPGAFSSSNAQAADPAGDTDGSAALDGILNLEDDDYGWGVGCYMVPERLVVVPYGSDAANESATLRIVGWQEVENFGGTGDSLWIPSLISSHVVTLGAATATGLGAGHFLADTITAATGEGDVTKVVSNALDEGAFLVLRNDGFRRLQFKAAVSTAADLGVLVRPG